MLKNLVYFGSPEFSAQILEDIIASKQVNIVGVVTTPDKPLGRKQIFTPSPVSAFAERHNLPIFKPAKLDDDHLAHIKLLKPDIFLVVSYGRMIPEAWLGAPSIGTFNLHFSLLPKYRGALCISEAIKNGDTETGVTLMVMDNLMDHGSIISQTKVAIDIDDNVAQLTTKLTQAGMEIIRHKLPEICAQNYSSTPQNETAATYTPSHKTISHASAFIPYAKITDSLAGVDAKVIHDLIRSNNPEPGAWTSLPDKTEIKLIKTSIVNDRLVIDTVQLPSKNPISWKQFLSGHPLHF